MTDSVDRSGNRLGREARVGSVDRSHEQTNRLTETYSPNDESGSDASRAGGLKTNSDSPLVSGTPEGRTDDEIRADLATEEGQGSLLRQSPTGRLVADVPALLARVEAAEAEVENQCERDGQHRASGELNTAQKLILVEAIVREAQAERDEAVAKLRAVEAALGRDRFGHIAKSRIRAALADPVGPQDERPARPQLHPLAKRERGTVALDGSAGPPGFGPAADPVGLPTEPKEQR